MRRSLLLVLALLVLAAGCAGSLPSSEMSTTATPGDTSTAAGTTAESPATTTGPATTGQSTTTRAPSTTDPVPTSAETATATATPGPTETPTATAAADNPWGTQQVVVAVENEAGFAHEKYDLFREALDYWTANAPRYAGYDVEFVLEPDATSPDVTIRYVEAVDECGETPATENTLGCAPVYRSGHVRDQTVVEIRENDDDVQLVETTKHEFGHVLGIAHGEEPMPLMAEDNLYLKASPWNRSAIRYAFDSTDGPGFSDEYLEGHAAPAFRYLQDGAGGALASPPGFERVDAPSGSNVVVEFHRGAHGESGFEGSVVETSFEGAIEGQPYARYTIALYDLDPDAMAWHVASQLVGILLTKEDSRPEVLDPDECGYDCRRGDWWT